MNKSEITQKKGELAIKLYEDRPNDKQIIQDIKLVFDTPFSLTQKIQEIQKCLSISAFRIEAPQLRAVILETKKLIDEILSHS